MSIITEEMRYRKRLCEYAKKYGVTKAARKYHTNRQFVYRQLEKYNGTLKSLALKSRKPHSHPNAHTEEELNLIKKVKSRYGIDGLAEVYVQLRKRGYTRSYGSMVKQISKLPKEETKLRKGYTIIDIGITTTHAGMGWYYGIERFIIAQWKYRNMWKLPVNLFL